MVVVVVVGQALVLVAGGALLWSYLVYPILIARLARRAPVPPTEPGPVIPVAVFVAARNEEQSLRSRLDNLLAQEYPPEAVEVVVVDDGSADGTADVVRGLANPRVSLFSCPDGPGKSAAVSRAIEHHGYGDVLVFTDATTEFPPDGLRKLLTPFASPEVGATSGLVGYRYPHGSAIADGFLTYQRIVVPHRHAESAANTLLSVSGAMSACRRELWRAPPADVSTDLSIPLEAAVAGARTVMAPAGCRELARARAGRELQSRIRQGMGAGAFIALLRRRRRELPGRYLLGVLSHKVLRWWSPFLALVLIVGAALAGWWTILALAGVALGLALLGLVPRIGPYFGVWLFAATVLLGTAIGLLRHLMGGSAASWSPDGQR